MWGLCVSDCINVYAGGKGRAYTRAVCNRSLSCNVILNDLLQAAQVYVYVHLTNEKNPTSNANLSMDCSPSSTRILQFAEIICSLEIAWKVTKHKAN
jgi:hypothetical protein